MRVDEAREMLGVSADCDPGTLRRAYLRKLKQHKPESDPEGFQRVRTAYELLSRFVAAPDPRDDEPIVERQGGGPRMPASTVLDTAPEAASTPDVDESGSEPPPWERKLSKKRPKHAARTLAEWLEASARDPRVPEPPLHLAIDVLLTSMRGHHHARADRLFFALHDAIKGAGAARALGPYQVTWSLTKRLWENSELLPDAVYLAMLDGVLHHDPAVAGVRLRRFRSTQPAEAHGVLQDLSSAAPELVGAFGTWLRPEKAVVDQNEREANRSYEFPWRWLVWPAIIMLRLATSRGETRVESSPTQDFVDASQVVDKMRDAVARSDCDDARRRLVWLQNRAPGKHTSQFDQVRRDFYTACPDAVPPGAGSNTGGAP